MPDISASPRPAPSGAGSRPDPSTPAGSVGASPRPSPDGVGPRPATPSAPVVKIAPSGAAGISSSAEPEIHVIPEKFYGAALRAKFAEKEKTSAPAPGSAEPASQGIGRLAIPIILGIVVLLGIAGGFVWFNRSLLFPPPKPVVTPVVTPPPPPPPPAVPDAPTNLSATTTSPSVVALTWTDASDDEAGFRVERRESASSYASVTSLGPNSTAWQDQSLRPDTDYLYRVIALNEGGDSQPSNEAAVRTPPPPPPPPEVPTLPPAGLDSDSDGLTDLEEPLYGSPLRDPDADKDSYNDGNEVFHLYSPSGKAPGTLLGSGLVKSVSSSVGWSVFMPSSWQVIMDESGMRATIATGHGETFSVTVEDMNAGQPLLDWYLARNPGVLSSQVKTVVTKSGYEGIEGADQLTVYFPWGSKILTLRYDLDGQTFVNYRTTFEMMKNSLTLTPTPVLPDTAPAPQPPAPESVPMTLEAPTSSNGAPADAPSDFAPAGTEPDVSAEEESLDSPPEAP